MCRFVEPPWLPNLVHYVVGERTKDPSYPPSPKKGYRRRMALAFLILSFPDSTYLGVRQVFLERSAGLALGISWRTGQPPLPMARAIGHRHQLGGGGPPGSASAFRLPKCRYLP